ncbi:MAG: DNA polymerase III subunit gamma/tau [Saprospiraceae bacterium]
MSNFIVSARKYRPRRFEDVVGQQHVAQTLRNALSAGQVAHAFLFTGPRGVGKTTCARILAQTLNCERRSESQEPCGECASCKAFVENASFNILELDAASNNSVEHIRALTEQVRFPPQQGAYKVFIIDEVHMLSNQAFNAFLKTLEEPPPYAIFILATTEKHKIIPTILSRCQIFDFRRITVGDMTAHLESICAKEGIKAEPEALHIIAQKADGALRDALSIFDRVTSFNNRLIRYADVVDQLGVLDFDYYFRMTDALLTENAPEVLNLFDQVLRKGFDAEVFLSGLSEHIRNVLVCKDPQTTGLLEAVETLGDRYRRQAESASASFLMTALSLANDCDVNYKMARNKRLHVEIALLKMCHSQRATPVAPPAHPEKKTADLSAPAALPPGPAASVSTSAPTPEPRPQANARPLSRPQVEQLQADLRSGAKKVEPIALSLGAYEEAVVVEEAERALRESRLSHENLIAAWREYAPKRSTTTMRLALSEAELRLNDNKAIAVRVGMRTHLNLLQEEAVDLLEHLRERLCDNHITLRFEVDESRLPEAQTAPRRALSPQEKLQRLLAEHPETRNLVEALDLKPDD